MKKLLLALAMMPIGWASMAQTGTEFWMAPPDVTLRHNMPGDEPIFLNVTTGAAAAVVTVSQPANPAFNGGNPIVLNVPANAAVRHNLTALKAQLETRPTNMVRNTGLLIESTAPITCYYELSNTNNPDIMALKGANGLGTEFYIPLHKHAPFYNHNFMPHSSDLAFASFDIVATENNTTVMIYSPVAVDGHPALTPFTITLNRGETYSCGNTNPLTHFDPLTHPSGAVVLANKPVAVSLKDDSNHNPSGGCYDLMLDQIVPVNILGTDYVAIKGGLNPTGDESMFIMAVQNNTQVYINGSATPVATLFAGQYFRHDMDYLSGGAVNSAYISTSKPAYAIHVTGFGCEQGMAIMPPLNCAGSQQLSFTRATTESFFLHILVRNGSQNDFVVNGPGTATIPGTAFQTVPGTGGEWMAARIGYNTTQVPVNQAFIVSNTSDVFSLAIINGGATSGCRYGFFSEFSGKILVEAGPDQTRCASDLVELNGSVSGGSTTGIWSTTGSGTFEPSPAALNATYVPSIGDLALGTVTLTLTSTGPCTPESDDLVVTFSALPIPEAGTPISVCANSPTVQLQGSVLNAVGGVWTGGAGTFLPASNNLNANYNPTPAEVNAGSVLLFLTTTGNGVCPAVTDSVVVTIAPAPVANAGADQTLCGNNAAATLNGSFIVATGGIWSGGAGSFDPSTTNTSAVYTPTAGEIANGSVTLTLTTTGNGNCVAVSDAVTLFYTPAPTANAGSNVSVCANNSAVPLNGSVTVASGGIWSGGTGSFNPGNTTLNATYTPTQAEIAAGTLTLTLTTTGNGNCLPATAQRVITFTPAPIVNAGAGGSVCANSPAIALNGSVIGATGGIWTGGAGSFSPNNATLNATYTPTAAEIANGSVTLTLTSAGNGNCNPESHAVTWAITPSPTANAGADLTLCANNPAAQLNGSFTVATGGLWAGGGGSYSPSNTNMGAVYTPTSAEIANGSVTLTLSTTGNGACSGASDQVTLNFTPAPVVNAGPDVAVCANNANVSLGGSVTGATGGIWSGGGGSFTPNNTTLNATYTPTSAEIAAGTLTLTLTSTGNGNCNAVADQVTVTFTPAPIVSAGSNGSVCANNAAIALNGSVTGATGGIWSGGAGSFSPNNTTLNATYTPTAAQIANGSVTLTLTSVGYGNCNPVSSQVTYTITPAPTVNAGADLILCSNNPAAQLNGSFTVATGAIWSGGNGSYNPGNTNMGAVYTPTPAEIANGSVTLTLTTTGNGLCNAVSDQVTLNFTPAPVVNAGPDVAVCANNANVSLGGSVTGAAGGIWSGGGGSFTPNNTTLSATYTPTPAEIAAGTLTLTLTSTGNGNCNAVADQVTITFSPAPIVSAGTNGSVCANNATIVLNGSVTGATGGIWSGGAGSFTPNNTTLNATYTPTAAQIANGSVTLTLTSVGHGNCNAVSSQVTYTITPTPTVNAGADLTLCSNNPAAQLNGSFTVATGAIWSGGNGSYNPGNTNMGAVYTPTPAEIANGNVTLTLTTTGNGLCNAVSDQVTLNFTSAPVVNAGPDVVVCANNANVSLGGSVTGATGGIWSGGGGSFTPNNTTLTATYTPTPAEIAAGILTLTLTSTGNGNCNAVADQMTVTFTPAPIVSAGTGSTVCANNSAIALNGSVTGATGGIWSGGNGSFSPNNTTLNASYTPTAAEIANGSVTLTLTSIGHGNCNPVSSQVTYSITSAPTVNAGPDNTLCANNATAALSGAFSIATGAVWSGGSGTFSPSTTNMNAIYTPSPADIAAGSVTLTLTTTGNGLCNAVSDQVVLTFTDPPSANAGPDVTVCANNAAVALGGSVVVASGGAWSGGTGTFSPNTNTLNATYNPGAADIAAGQVTLTLTTTGNGNCLAATDTRTIFYTPAPIVSAGTNGTVCANAPQIALNGSVNGAVGGVWSGGTGTFTPNNITLNATYMPSAAEIAAGNVTLTLTSAGNGNCNPVTSQVTWTITPSPTVNAGADQTLCGNNANAVLNAAITGATGVQWSGGAGLYAPGSTAQNITYSPSPIEVANGSVTLTATTTGNGLCNAVSDQVTLFFTPAPTANAGPDQSVSSNNPNTQLAGSSTVASGIVWSGGAGSYSPNNTTSNAVYTPTASEIAAGTVTLTMTTTGNGSCAPASDQMTITFTAAPTANAGPDQTTCANNASVQLNGTITIATGGIWSGGTGSFIPNNATLNATYIPSAAEIAAGSVTLTLTTVGNGNSNPVSDQMVITITPAPVVNPGNMITVCANQPVAQLTGVINNATGGIWSGGAGAFDPGNTNLNATYTPSLGEIAAGQVTLTLTSTGNGQCNAVSANLTIQIAPAPVVDAGADQLVCTNNASVQLSGSVGNAGGGIWSGGTGGFSPSITALGATYTPSTTELNNGSVTLTLTSTGNGTCAPVSDQIFIVFSTSPSANAGPDVTVCANDPTVQLNGAVTVSGGGLWSGGTGSFSPGPAVLNATYVPSPAEVALGGVTLTLTTTQNGQCNAVNDQIVITIIGAPVANAGNDIFVCSNNPLTQLGGSVSGAGGGQWSGGAGVFSPSIASLNATYMPTPAEVAAGSLTLTLTTIGTGNCVPVSDQVLITFTPSPTANAGVDGVFCANNAAIQLNGAVTVANGGSWSGAQGNFGPNANTLNAVYTPSAGELAAGSVTLTLTTTGNNGCTPVSDQVTFSFTPAPTANAGPDLVSCANNASVPLNGAVTVATGGSWSGGTGTYSPGNASLNATYTPSAAEIAAGQAVLTLTTVGNGTCNAVSDQVVVTINAAPIVQANTPLQTCANNASVQLSGSVQHASGGVWSGAGTFSPSANNLNAVYQPTAGEIAAGSATVILTSTGNGLCNAVSTQVTINISPAPIANAGAGQVLCANNAITQLSGSVTGANGGAWTGGSGTFSPNASTLNASYAPSASEIGNGGVWLFLNTTGNGGCLSVQDSLWLAFTPAPTANAGPDMTVCANAAAVSLQGAITVAGGALWSGGNGTFSPTPQALNATYTPTAFEIADGQVTLTLTTTGNGTCNAVSDAMTISFDPVPVVNAGPDQAVCANNAGITLNGFVGNAPGGIWTGGAGTFFPSNTALATQYQPTAEEIANGSITFILTSTGTTICTAMSDQMTVTFTGAPIVDAGMDQTVCVNNPAVQLNGDVTNANGGTWSGGNGAFSPSANVLSPVYTPTASELAAGHVTLTLTSTGNGNCFATNDAVTIQFTPAPVVNAGLDANICVNNPVTQLNGSVTVASGATWSGGLGTFSPNAQTLDAQYIPTPFELQQGSVTLTLTSTGNGNCLSVSDQVTLTMTPAPVVDAGNDLTICSNALQVPLSGTVQGGASSGLWSTSGTGSFFPSANVLNATYVASSLDSLNGSVDLTLTSTNNGLCNAVTDMIAVTILPNATAFAGPDQAICAAQNTVQLNGAITGNATEGTWSTTGGGTFLPNANAANAIYQVAPGDAVQGTLVFTWSVNSCDNAMDQMSVSITPVSTVNAGPDVVTCVSSLNVLINGTVSGASSTGVWTTLGTGSFANPANALSNIYQASSQDSLLTSVSLVLTATNTGACAPAADTLHISILPFGTVNAGPDLSFCANNAVVQLNGSLSGDATQIQWTTSGTGSFFPNNAVLTPTYIPSAVDTAIGNLTLTISALNSCNNASDAMQLSLTPAPYVNAGPDQTFCELVDQFSLSGVISGVTNVGQWTTTGTGSIANAGALNTTYTASAADIANGQVTLTLTSLNNGNCNAVSDAMTIYITNAVIADAGPNQSVCVLSEFAQMQGTIINGSPSGTWSTTGSGTFFPSADVLNAAYHFSAADVANGSVVLMLTATNTGTCPATQDQMVLTFGASSFAFAGADQSVCANAPIVQLAGNFSGGASGMVWSTSGSGSFSNTTNPNATYTLSSADLANGGVTLTLTTITNGNCAPASDAMVVNVQQLPTINAGNDIVACSSAAVQLVANAVNAPGGMWTTSGSGTFLNPNALVTLYHPSAADSIAGSVVLTVTTTGVAPCSAVSDQLVLSFGGGLSAIAGADVIACSNDPQIALNGSVSGTTTGQWSTTGTGSFSPSATALNATYVPGPADFVIGNVSLILTTTNNQGCPAGVDTLVVSYHQPPVVNAGPDQIICNGLQPVQLNGTAQHAGSVQWGTMGSGSFADALALATTYTPTANDSLAGGVWITLTAIGTGTCGNAHDSLYVDIVPARIANAGADQFLCADGTIIQLNGAVSGASGGVWSTTGTGTFLPDNSALTVQYLPSATDLVFPALHFVLSTTGNMGCQAGTDTVTVHLQTPPTVNAGMDISTCDAEAPVQLGGSFSGAAGVQWSTNGTGAFLPNMNDLAATYQPGVGDVAMGSIQLVLTTTGNQFCPATSDTLVISFTNPLVAAFNLANACAGSQTVFTSTSTTTGPAIIGWNWSFSNGATANGPQVNTSFAEPGQYLVTLTVFAANGCQAEVSQTITVLEAPVAGFSFHGEPFTGEVIEFNDHSTGATGWYYNFGDGQGSIAPQPVHVYQLPGQYIVVQTVTNAAGCTDQDSLLIVIERKDILPPKLPNAFSPNGDGVNDVFFVRGGPFETIDLKIYNGWGQLIFETTDPEFGWDGTHRGHPSINGVYVYTVLATTEEGEVFDRSGKVTLVR